jgi:hypothetical protein
MSTPSLVLDFTQPAASVMLAQINFDNGTQVTGDQIRFGQVAELPADDPSGMNTLVFVAALQGASFEGQEYFRYNRIDISTVPGTRSPLFSRSQALTVADIIGMINQRFSLNLSQDDIVDEDLPIPGAGQTVPFTLIMSANSLLWRGSVVLSLSN